MELAVWSSTGLKRQVDFSMHNTQMRWKLGKRRSSPLVRERRSTKAAVAKVAQKIVNTRITKVEKMAVKRAMIPAAKV